MKVILVSLAIGGILTACASPSNPESHGNVITGVIVQPGRDFEMVVGQEVKVDGSTITIRFNGVSDDSRCPTDVQCVWAGNAIARFVVSAAGTPATSADLNTTLEPKSVSYAGFTVRLTGLRPAPRSGTPIPASSYVASLEVRPN